MMKNKIIGLFMLAAVSMVGIGGCGSDDKKDGGKNGATGFTSIDVKANSATEAEVTLKFEKGTKLDDYSIKFEGSAVDGSTKANGKEVKDTPVKLANLGTAGEEDLKFKVEHLKVGKLTVSLVNAKGEVVKGKDNKEISKKDVEVKASTKPTAEFKAAVKSAAVTLTVNFKNLVDEENVKNYSFETTEDVILDSETVKGFALAPLTGKGLTWDKDKKVLTIELTATAAKTNFTLKTSDKDKFVVGGKETVEVNATV